MLRVPSGGAGEALGRNTLSVTADVVDAARQRKCREERAPGIGDVQCGAEIAHRLVEPRTRTVEQPKSQDDTAPAGASEALSLPLGDERGAQDRQNLADRRVLAHGPVRRIDKRDRGLNVNPRPGRDRRVDEDPRSVRAKPVILAPRVRFRHPVERTDPGRQVQHAVDVARGLGDRGGIEEVELVVSRRH